MGAQVLSLGFYKSIKSFFLKKLIMNALNLMFIVQEDYEVKCHFSVKMKDGLYLDVDWSTLMGWKAYDFKNEISGIHKAGEFPFTTTAKLWQLQLNNRVGLFSGSFSVKCMVARVPIYGQRRVMDRFALPILIGDFVGLSLGVI